MIRVLIADDSATARQLLTHILSLVPDIEVVGEACNGEEAVRKALGLRPNLILMDLHMPVLDGMAATLEIMTLSPTPIVLISSSSTVHNVETAMQALRAGAVTVLRKPTGPGDPKHEQAGRELIETIRAMSDVKVVRRLRLATSLPANRPVQPRLKSHPQVAVCAVATSTGGPPALLKLFGGLPANFAVPILVVQHIATGFTEGLAKWLDDHVALSVKVAESGERLRLGTVYMARENAHLGVASDGTALLSKAAPIHGFRPSATFLFQSVANVYGPRTLAVILTGMGSDGIEGLRKVKEVGGTVLAQDESSCVVFGMPGAAVAEKLPDQTLPLDLLAGSILARVG